MRINRMFAVLIIVGMILVGVAFLMWPAFTLAQTPSRLEPNASGIMAGGIQICDQSWSSGWAGEARAFTVYDPVEPHRLLVFVNFTLTDPIFTGVDVTGTPIGEWDIYTAPISATLWWWNSSRPLPETTRRPNGDRIVESVYLTESISLAWEVKWEESVVVMPESIYWMNSSASVCQIPSGYAYWLNHVFLPLVIKSTGR